MPLTPGQVLNNRYRIVKLLGQGGFGAVYRAWDINMKAPCAVKENFDTSPAASSQFEREATLLFQLRHPNLPRVYDHFLVPGQGQYLVMDFIEGQDLQTMLDLGGPGRPPGAPLPEAQALAWIGQVADALAYMHRQKTPVIHRDIKPANIVITPDGQAVLVDFGIAKAYNPLLKTTAGARAVTQGYSPIEQYGHGTTDARSDVYSLGATLYTLLTGKLPPEATARAVRDSLGPAILRDPRLSPGTAQALSRALQLDPEQRFQSAAELANALHPVPTRPQPPTVSAPQAHGAPYGLGQVGPASQPSRSPAGGASPARYWLIGGLLALFLVVFLLIANAIQFWPFAPKTPTPLPTAKPAISPTEFFATQRAVLPTSSTGPPANARPGDAWIRPADGMTMIFIPEGEFLMGSADSDANAQSDEKPQHTVYLDAYWIDQTQVTNAQYSLCVAAGACQPPSLTRSSTRSSYYGNSQYDNYPVIYVSWDDALAYCAWAGGRLPTEAQWEKAARGVDGRIYPWGNQAPDCNLANYWGKDNGCVGDTAPVGEYSPQGDSPYGLFDMAGNVWEWVQDYYSDAYYDSSPSSNPTGPSSGQYRVLRGGYWYDSWYSLRVAYRDFNYPGSRGSIFGFRCGVSPGE